jgi:hypothetical protein
MVCMMLFVLLTGWYFLLSNSYVIFFFLDLENKSEAMKLMILSLLLIYSLTQISNSFHCCICCNVRYICYLIIRTAFSMTYTIIFAFKLRQILHFQQNSNHHYWNQCAVVMKGMYGIVCPVNTTVLLKSV